LFDEGNDWQEQQSQIILNQTTSEQHQNMNFPIRIDYIRNDTIWLITFQFEPKDSDQTVMDTINRYFQGFVGLNIKTRIYVVAFSNEKTQMFEVYKKDPNLDVTIQLLCKLNGLLPKYVNQDDIWTRRKNLTGVNFRVGYVPNNTFFQNKNEVRGRP
jgi:hypothetical protein